MGLNLAGTVLEKVSGVRFDNYVRQNVINRLGLYGGHNVDSLDASRIARIYRIRDGVYEEATGAYASRANVMPDYVHGYSAPIFSPTGGVKISARDLAQYMMMHMNYGEYNGTRIISEESARAMQTPVWIAKNEGDEQYGLCLREFIDFVDDARYNTPGNYPIGHTGGAYGLRSIMIWSPADNWGIVAMTNGYTGIEDKDLLKTIVNAIYDASIKELE
jgi:CubicO group peptidase (beta-lactamase class C family)